MKKILVIRFSSIGDMVLTTPVIRCLKQQVSGAEIHYLSKKQYEPVLYGNPYIDRRWLYDHNFSELIPMLRRERFDAVIDLHKNFRSLHIRRMLRRPYHSFPKLNVEKWMAVHLKMNLLPSIHIVDRYFKAVEFLKVKNDGAGLDFYIRPEDEADPTMIPASHRSGYMAVVNGARHNTKIFPAEMVARVIREVGKPVILLGGKEDEERGEQVAKLAGSLVFNGCGKFSLPRSASLLRQSAAVLANDTGLMHIAAAFNKPLVSVWGNTIPAFGMFPYFPAEDPAASLIAEVASLRCRPCSKIGYPECPKKHFRCMNDIDIDLIVRFLKQF